MSENNEREYRVWLETGDLMWSGDDPQEAERQASAAREMCPCLQKEPECGVIHPHGISIQVVESGDDVTQDYLING